MSAMLRANQQTQGYNHNITDNNDAPFIEYIMKGNISFSAVFAQLGVKRTCIMELFIVMLLCMCNQCWSHINARAVYFAV